MEITDRNDTKTYTNHVINTKQVKQKWTNWKTTRTEEMVRARHPLWWRFFVKITCVLSCWRCEIPVGVKDFHTEMLPTDGKSPKSSAWRSGNTLVLPPGVPGFAPCEVRSFDRMRFKRSLASEWHTVRCIVLSVYQLEHMGFSLRCHLSPNAMY